jgi:hypothetical protein
MPDPFLELDQLNLKAAKFLVIFLTRKDGLSHCSLTIFLALQLRGLRHLAQQCSARRAFFGLSLGQLPVRDR